MSKLVDLGSAIIETKSLHFCDAPSDGKPADCNPTLFDYARVPGEVEY
jgi:hypothetical protein